MAKYYESYKILIMVNSLIGVYFSSIENIYGPKLYIKWLKYLFILPAAVMPVYSAFSLKYLFFDDDGMGNKMYGYMMVVFSCFTTFTFYSFYYYRNELQRVFELWDSMFQEEIYPKEKEELLSKNRRMTNGWLKIFGTLNILVASGYFMVTFGNPSKKVAHPTGIPYRPQSPDFELMNTLDLIICIFGFGSVVMCDSTMMVFLSLEEAQMQHLKQSLARILDVVTVTDSGKFRIESAEVDDIRSEEVKTAFEEITKNVGIWVCHHHQILRFHNELQKIFSLMLSVKFFVFVLLICLFCLLSLSGKLRAVEITMGIVFCCNNYALFYVNVTFADSTAETSLSIFGDAFEKSWYLCPRNLRTAFHIVVMQSHVPVQYKAFKIYSLSSNSFLKILSSAYSSFTFMLQLNGKKGGMLVTESPLS